MNFYKFTKILKEIDYIKHNLLKTNKQNQNPNNKFEHPVFEICDKYVIFFYISHEVVFRTKRNLCKLIHLLYLLYWRKNLYTPNLSWILCIYYLHILYASVLTRLTCISHLAIIAIPNPWSCAAAKGSLWSVFSLSGFCSNLQVSGH